MEQDQDDESFFRVLAKAQIVYEGEETRKFLKTIKGQIADDEGSQGSGSEDEEEDDDEEQSDDEDLCGGLLKYESPFIKRMLIP